MRSATIHVEGLQSGNCRSNKNGSTLADRPILMVCSLSSCVSHPARLVVTLALNSTTVSISWCYSAANGVWRAVWNLWKYCQFSRTYQAYLPSFDLPRE
jgi:hypothetical protein